MDSPRLFNVKEFIGLTIDEALALLKPHSLTIREIYRNGKPLIVTNDYQMNRINVETAYGYIIDVRGQG